MEMLDRDLMDPWWPGLTESDWEKDAKVLAVECLALLAELEQAEKDAKVLAVECLALLAETGAGREVGEHDGKRTRLGTRRRPQSTTRSSG